jgi:hypothetical protein
VAPGIAAISLDQAVTRAQTFLTSFNNPDLVIAEVMEFSGTTPLMSCAMASHSAC